MGSAADRPDLLRRLRRPRRAVIGFALPALYLRNRRGRRLRQFDNGLPRAMEVIITTVDLSAYDLLLETGEDFSLPDNQTCMGH